MYNIIAMLHDIVVSAYAKINIGLRVLPKRSDGYHDIESIFQTVSLCDVLHIEQIHGNGDCIVICDSMPLPAENTLTATYASFCRVARICPSVRVVLEKHIPAGAGLGGGSSDAASFLRGLDTLFKTGLTFEQMQTIAGSVGSDVFFFLSCDANGLGSAVVTGRGDTVHRIRQRSDLNIVVACPAVHSSTAEAYALVDEYMSREMQIQYPPLGMLEAMYRDQVCAWSFVNSFEIPLTERYPVIGKTLTVLRDCGADFVQMSGSGSAVFGVFETSVAAENASAVLADKGIMSHCTFSC